MNPLVTEPGFKFDETTTADVLPSGKVVFRTGDHRALLIAFDTSVLQALRTLRKHEELLARWPASWH